MKPLSNKVLKELLNEKLTVSDQNDQDHLWSGIEMALPQKTSLLLPIALGSAALIILLGSWLVFFDSEIPEEEILMRAKEIEKDHSKDIVDTSSKQFDAVDSTIKQSIASNLAKKNRPQSATKNAENNQGSNFQNSTTPFQTSITSQSPSIFFNNEGKLISDPTEMNSVSVAFQRPTDSPFLIPKSTSEEEFIFPQDSLFLRTPTFKKHKNFWFLSISSYLSYHKLSPSHFDEYIIAADPQNYPTISERIGINATFGRSYIMNKKISLESSIGLDYYQTKFHFIVLNNVNSQVSLHNNRLDLGIALGVHRSIKSFLGNGSINVTLGGRIKLINFSKLNTENYSARILHYRFMYLFYINKWNFGPFYSSFLTPENGKGYGQIKPSIYGLSLRRRLHTK